MVQRAPSIFLSYAREDASFVDALDAGLQAAGYDPLIDRVSLLSGERWRERLYALIAEADTVLFVLSPSFLQSDTCQREIDWAVELGKRLLPVVCHTFEAETLHPHLARLHFVRFDNAESFAHALRDLAQALRQDIDWLRAHSALLSRARDWNPDEPERGLMIGDDVSAAADLLNTRPASAPDTPMIVLDYLAASKRAELARKNAELRRQEERQIVLDRLARRTTIGLGAGVVLLAALALTSVFIWQQKEDLDASELRLAEGIKLHVADTERRIDAAPKWYRVVTDHKLAIGVVKKPPYPDQPSAQMGTGFLMKGGSLAPDWAGQTVFVTAAHVLSTNAFDTKDTLDAVEKTVTFPAYDGAQQFRLGRILFYSHMKKLDFAALAVADDLPDALTALALEDPEDEALDGLGVLNWTAKFGFAFGIGHVLRTEEVPDWAKGAPRHGISYTHVTAPGASGAPVFSLATAKLVCMHQRGFAGGSAGAVPRGYDGRSWAFCTKFTEILAAIKAAHAAE